MTGIDLRDRIASVLDEHRHKPARVQAGLVLQLIDGRTPSLPDVPADVDRLPPPRFTQWSKRNQDVLAQAVAQGDATTRNRTDAAMRALGLEPHEVCAVVIERDYIRIFRWADRGERLGMGMPIIEEESA